MASVIFLFNTANFILLVVDQKINRFLEFEAQLSTEYGRSNAEWNGGYHFAGLSFPESKRRGLATAVLAKLVRLTLKSE